jgi:O-antigen ligase
VLAVGGMLVNNRRLAYVELAAALLVLFLVVPPSRLKRAALRAALVSLPVVALYAAAGWSSNAPVFRPVQTIRTVVDSDSDRSSQTRDIENFNLFVTFKQHPLLGTGFGHEYVEYVAADTIAHTFPQYRYIPHNSLLGLWAFAGTVGFAAIWMPLAVAVFLALRSHDRARRPLDRAAALAVIATVVAFMGQAYGDMGLQSWEGSFLLALALSVAAQLAAAVGAWPAPSTALARVRAGPVTAAAQEATP